MGKKDKKKNKNKKGKKEAKLAKADQNGNLEAAAAEEEIVYTCEGCGAKCCKHVTIAIPTPDSKSDYDEILWFLLHKGVSVFIDDDDDWSVEFATECEGLDGEFCGIYEDRPKVCSDYDIESCVRYGEGPYYKVRWETRAEFVAWMDKKKIKWRYKKYPKSRYRNTLPLLTIQGGDQA